MNSVKAKNRQGKARWETFTRGKYTEYRMMVERSGRNFMQVQLIPTACDGVPGWEARTSSGQYRVDASTPEEAKAKVERKEWIDVSDVEAKSFASTSGA